MDNSQRVHMWIEAGKQVGKSFSFERDNVIFWSSVAIQRWNDGYKLYIDEIEEEYIQGEEYAREEIIYRTHLYEIEDIIKQTTSLTIDDLVPLKGQKIFNPKFE